MRHELNLIFFFLGGGCCEGIKLSGIVLRALGKVAREMPSEDGLRSPGEAVLNPLYNALSEPECLLVKLLRKLYNI